MRPIITTVASATCLLAGLLAAGPAAGNGGPFAVHYPGGNVGAKGVSARLDPSLKPTRETRLRVVEEELTIRMQRVLLSGLPVAEVKAAYTIENPTGDEVRVHFGFPILRDILGGGGFGGFGPNATLLRVTVDKARNEIKTDVITTSLIYGLMRRSARAAIEKGIAADKELAGLVAAVREARDSANATEQRAGRSAKTVAAGKSAPGGSDAAARPSLQRSTPELDRAARPCNPGSRSGALGTGATRPCWPPSPASIPARAGTPGPMTGSSRSGSRGIRITTRPDRRKKWQKCWPERERTSAPWMRSASKRRRSSSPNWPGASISTSRPTTRPSSRPGAATSASGPSTSARGAIRPREFDAKAAGGRYHGATEDDPTVYTRVDYLSTKGRLSEFEKAVCLDVLKNLPVTFTFAPMNLVHYQVTFPPNSRRVVTVCYAQHAYVDTAGKGSYQLAYVLHPATFWDNFGPIHLTVLAKKGVACKAWVPLEPGREVTTRDGAFRLSPDRPRIRPTPPR